MNTIEIFGTILLFFCVCVVIIYILPKKKKNQPTTSSIKKSLSRHLFRSYKKNKIMTTDEKIKEAKRLMIEVSKERRQKIKDNSDNEICKCGHKFKTHTHTLSINYTAGFCSISKCNCEHFLTKFNPSNS